MLLNILNWFQCFCRQETDACFLFFIVPYYKLTRPSHYSHRRQDHVALDALEYAVTSIEV